MPIFGSWSKAFCNLHEVAHDLARIAKIRWDIGYQPPAVSSSCSFPPELIMPTELSRRARKLTSSAIREILKVTASPDVISFAGGIPAPETFPVDLLHTACEQIFAEEAREALQYSLTEGFLPLRQWIASRHSADVDQVLITTGSQQALDLLAKALLDPGVTVLVESPTYLGALQAFSLFEPSFRELPCDDAGICTAELTPADAADARLAYLMPNFQNPTGRLMSAERRHDVCRLMGDAGVLIVEDDPYGELGFNGQRLQSLRSIHPEGVAYLGSFSKVLAPGLRVGYVVAPAWLTAKLTQLKQAADLHSSTFDQRLAYRVLASGALPAQIDTIRKLYASRCDAMLQALQASMAAEVRWNRPEGGMFIWLNLPPQCDSHLLLQKSIAVAQSTRVAFVPGAPFHAVAPRSDCLRLSFVTVDAERIRIGICQLAENIRTM